ncbi:unnamed protein product [Acanthoscelides obtectus]|uniref:DUF4758 domain-containing protein n=2 Tax=Acanthoscelides obtectus TaxID=200917 RepID=A0A9P0P3F7_ACAOB|nr:unnamed protein product [Acanthoscelides obtectus]CAK1668876.1 hypothetical protein AOBTE_LOCUS26655 [Acanthoscelides obtectus]
MVFSPQSSEAIVKPPEPPKPQVIINSNPPPVVNEIKAIKPTKTNQPKPKPAATQQEVHSVVHVQTEAPPPITKVEVKTGAQAVTKVNVVEGLKTKVSPVVASKVQVVEAPSSSSVPTGNVITKVEVIEGNKKQDGQSNTIHQVVHVKSDDSDQLTPVGNFIGTDSGEDLLSKQPSELVEETVRGPGVKPSSKFILRHRPSADAGGKKAGKKTRAHPTGLVTKLGGKYAQVLQTNSKRIAPTQTQSRILKTAGPSFGRTKQRGNNAVEPTPAVIPEEISLPVEALFSSQATPIVKATRKPNGAFKRFKNRQKESESEQRVEAVEQTTHQPSYKSKNRSHQSGRNSKQTTARTTPTHKHSGSGGGKRKRTRTTTTTTPAPVHSEEPTTKRAGKGGRRGAKQREANNEQQSGGGFSRRGFKPKVQPTPAQQEQQAGSSSLYKFKLNRTPGRWQYKTTSKPRVSIRKQNPTDEPPANNSITSGQNGDQQPQQQPVYNEAATPQSRSDDVDGLEGSESVASIVDDEEATDNKLDTPAFPLETIKVEISTPPDFGDIYYEIATIKSPYTFQVGSVRNTRYVTVTSTFEKSLDHRTVEPTNVKPNEPLTENILATAANYKDNNNILDSSIATLPPLYLASDVATPPLETLTETFSTTQTLLKTHILPIIRFAGNESSTTSLVQTFVVTRLVTATKTLPPMEAYQFIPSKTLNEFNSRLDEAGSELHLELEFGDQNDQDDTPVRKVTLPADLNLANVGSNLDISDVDKQKLLEAQLRSKQNQAKQQAMAAQNNQQNQQSIALYGGVITTSKPIIKIETLYETFVLPVTQGHTTIQSTISKLKGTITKTDYEYGTSTVPPQLPPIVPHVPQVPQIPFNPFLPQPAPQFTVTSSPIFQSTTVTQTNSKVLKLTFGAKTAYTTVYSTTVLPTVLTSYMTHSVPVAPTAAAFPGYFPAPFPPYPYVG